MRYNQHKHNMIACLRSAAIAALLTIFTAQSAFAGMIRDAEIESYLKNLAEPVYKAAGLSSDQVRMFIVQDDAINAFVAGGANMFLHTGLITETETPEMLLGVMAHETGHIAGGHLLRGQQAIKNAQIGAVLTYLLGAAAIAGGGGDAGTAIIAASNHTATRQILAYTRGNEQAADQAALSYLDAIGISSHGMELMFERLRREEKQHIGANIDAYARTHPLSQQRIEHIRNHTLASPHKDKSLSASIHKRHQRIRGKLLGFLDDDGTVFRRYPKRDTSDEALVARAIAYSARSQSEQALSEMQALLVSAPHDAYAHELHGHILFELGNLEEAANAYQTAKNLAPDSGLIHSDYAKVLLALGQDKSAMTELTLASKLDPTYHQTWRLLSRAYGKQGDIASAELALAELSALNSDHKDIILHLDRAKQHGEVSELNQLRMDDLRRFADILETKDKKGKTIF